MHGKDFEFGHSVNDASLCKETSMRDDERYSSRHSAVLIALALRHCSLSEKFEKFVQLSILGQQYSSSCLNS